MNTLALDKKQLRHFGLLFGSLVIGLFGVLLPWIFSAESWPKWPWYMGLFFIVFALVAPRGLNPFYKLWMKFGLVMGFINTRIILFVLFYVLVMPIGLLMRLVGHDPMRRKFDKHAATYRIQSTIHDKSHMENPF